jgi:ABC-type polysaccharide/polyol phosphate transport system ATPase subunit
MSVVGFENVSKRYRLGQGRGSLRDALAQAVARLARRRIDEQANALWALKDLSFEVERGQTLGLVGVNGAGKSTVLKILSGVTRPTSGRVRIEGRVGALIEVGAGFHPDLTGRENIYLNGAILGLSRRAIDAKLESIIDFAELSAFIDTPVKRYSSGMYVRLGFSVAVHIDPDILLIDEVLAVGDYAFREKCVQKINDFRQDGRTLIVVSHDRHMLEKLCDRALLLHKGRLITEGEVRPVLDEYYTGKYREAERELPAGVVGPAAGDAGRPIEITRVQVADLNGAPRERFLTGEPCKIVVDFVCHQAVSEPVFYCDIHHEFTWVIGTNNGRTGASASFAAGEYGHVEMVIDSLNVLSGAYHLDVGAVSDYFAWRPYHIIYRAAEFEVTASLEQGAGLVHLPHTWRFVKPSGNGREPQPATTEVKP